MPNIYPFEVTSSDDLLNKCRHVFEKHPDLLKRSFVPVSTSLPMDDIDERKIRIMSWNVLADALCNGTENFIKCPKEPLQWQLRRYRCIEEMVTYDPDIICLQEVDHYHDFFQPLLSQIGYDGLFNPKPDSPCLDCPHNSGPDGCALFYKKNKFNLIKNELPVLADERNGSYWPTNQVAILNKLQCQSSGSTQHTFVVATTHLKAKPGWETLRHSQGCNLFDIAKKMSKECPFIIAGDFNAEPSEPIYKAFAESDLSSAYKLLHGANSEPLYTTWKIRPRGEMCHTIDYIWHSKDTIQPVALLDFPNSEDIGENRLPSWQYPSDHLSLVCDFVLTN